MAHPVFHIHHILFKAIKLFLNGQQIKDDDKNHFADDPDDGESADHYRLWRLCRSRIELTRPIVLLEFPNHGGQVHRDDRRTT